MRRRFPRKRLHELSVYAEIRGGESCAERMLWKFLGRSLEKESGRLVLDSHIPKPGTYRLIEMDEDEWKIIKTLDLYFDRKKQEMVGKNDASYLLIRELDYNSKLIVMNKPVDPKKVIHSNNYLSLAVKKNSISEGKLTREILEKYYEILENPIQKI